MYISLGPTCHAAANLKYLNYRTTSLPFDWLLCKEHFGIKYVNENINNNFSLFLKNLDEKNDKAYSKNYPEVLFYHHNLIKNPSYIKDFERRAKRFIDLISEPTNEINFLYCLTHGKKNKFLEFLQSIKDFESNDKIKAKFNLTIYVMNDDHNFTMEEYPKFNKTRFLKYIRNTKSNKLFGNKNDFKKLLDKIPKSFEEKEYFIIKPTGNFFTKLQTILSYKNRRILVVWEEKENFAGLFELIDNIEFTRNKNIKINYEGIENNPDFSLLRASKRVTNEVRKMINRNLGDNFCSFFATTKNKEFEKFILDNKDSKVLICTDNKEIQDYYTNFSDNTIYYKPMEYSLENFVIELFLCVKSKKFTGEKNHPFTNAVSKLLCIV